MWVALPENARRLATEFPERVTVVEISHAGHALLPEADRAGRKGDSGLSTFQGQESRETISTFLAYAVAGAHTQVTGILQKKAGKGREHQLEARGFRNGQHCLSSINPTLQLGSIRK